MFPPRAPFFSHWYRAAPGLASGRTNRAFGASRRADDSGCGDAAYPRSRAPGCPLRRRLHALSARARARARGVPAAWGSGTGSSSTPIATRRARTAAIEELQRNHELVHDEEIWIAFTEQIVLGMGGDPAGARACATDMVREWERHENFSLYEDALPVLDELRRHELKIGLDLERPARPRRVRRAPRARRRRGRRLEGARAREAASRRSSSRRSRRSMSRRTRRRWSATRTRTTSRARARSGSARSSSTATASSPDAPDRIDTLLALPAALGLRARLARAARRPCARRAARAPGASVDPNAAAASSRVQTGPTQTSSSPKCSSHSASVRSAKTAASSAASAS